MGIPSAAIGATNPILRRITLDVRIGGRPFPDALNATTAHGLSQVNATATVEGITRPGGAEETQGLTIAGGLQTSVGSGSDLIFVGEIDGVAWKDFPGSVPLSGRDKFARLRQNWGGDDREYTSQTSAAIIRNLAEAAGFDSSEMNIEEGDWGALGPWTLGTVDPVIARSGTPFWSLIERIDRLEGMRTFVDRAGKLLRRRVSGNIGSGAIWSYAEGENIISCERSRKLDGIVNHVIVQGLTFEGLEIGGEGVADVSAGNPFLTFPFEYITEAIQDDLIEDDDRALAIAARMVADRNRRPESYTLTVPFNPRVAPATVVQITHAKLETQSGSRFLVDQVTHRVGVFGGTPTAQTTFTTLGGALVNAATNIAPVASFVARFFLEGEDTGSGVERRVVVQADGSASYDPDGDSLSYAWTLAPDAGTIDPASPTTPIATALISGAAAAIAITLTVTDADGATDTMGPLPYALDAATLLIEPLYLAVDGTLKASVDGEQTWNESAASGATCTTPFAASWGAIWGDADGHVWITNDDLTTPAVDTGQPHGAVACTAVWLHELDTTRAWAAFADGQVYQGTVDSAAPGVAWVAHSTVPAGPVVEIREAIGALGSLRATAGAGYYAYEGAWRLLHTFAGTAARMAAGFEQNWASGAADPAPIVAETGTTPAVPGGVDSIPALTFGWQTQALYAADDAGQLYTTDATFAALTAHADASPVAVNHMIRSGNLDGLIYLAGIDVADSGALKWIPGVAPPFYIHRTLSDACYMVGYGPARRPAVDIDFITGTRGDTDPAGDGIWRYRAGVFTRYDPPHAAWLWNDLAVHPYTSSRWLALGLPGPDTNYVPSGGFVRTVTGSIPPIWRTDTGGLSWTAVDLPISDVPGSVDIAAVLFQRQSGRIVVIGRTHNETARIWVESGSAMRELTGLAALNLTWATSGNNGDILISEEDSPGSGTNGRLLILGADDSLTVGSWSAAPGGWDQPIGRLAVSPNDRQFWQTNVQQGLSAGICTFSDYRATDPASVGPPQTRANDLDGTYVDVAATADSVFFVSNNGGAASGYYRTAHGALPSGDADVNFANAAIIRADEQAHRTAVGYGTVSGATGRFDAWDGRAWSQIATPAAMTATPPVSSLAVIGQVELLP